MMCFFKKRGIDAETVKRFSNFLELVVDRDSKNKYRNLAFPYCDSSGNVVGFELRGFSGYRGKAEGTNSTSAFWCADFSEVRQPKYVFIFEGAYDAMAFQQIHNVKVRLEDCAFVSVGGSFSDEQFKQVINQYPNAKKVLCFDNDLNGRMYDIRAYGIINNLDMKTSINRENGDIKIDVGNKGIFELPEDKVSLNEFFKLSGYRQHPDLTIRKAPNGLKDWNEVLTRNLPIEDLHSAYEKKIIFQDEYNDKAKFNYWIANNVGSIILFILALILLGSDIPVIRWISLVIMGFTYIKGFYDYLYLNSLSWVLTAETLEIKSGIFSRSKNYIELYRINDYIEEQTFVERIFGVKRIILLSSDKTNPKLTIRGIDDSNNISEIIRERVEFNKQKKNIYEISNR